MNECRELLPGGVLAWRLAKAGERTPYDSESHGSDIDARRVPGIPFPEVWTGVFNLGRLLWGIRFWETKRSTCSMAGGSR